MNLTELKGVPVTPRGERSNRWEGIQHGDLVESLIKALKDLFGFQPIDPTYAVSPNGACMIGKFTLGQKPKGKRKYEPVKMTGLPHEVNQTVGFTHSNDSKKAFTLACGGEVLVCTNGMVVGSHAFKHRHTSKFELYPWLMTQLKVAWERIKTLFSGLDTFSKREVTQRMHDTHLLELGRRNIINWRLLEQIDKEWKTSGDSTQHPFHERNVWSWYNCVTEIIKRTPISLQMAMLEKAFNLARKMLPAVDKKKFDPKD